MSKKRTRKQPTDGPVVIAEEALNAQEKSHDTPWMMMMGGMGRASKSNEQSGLLHPRKEKKRFDADGRLADLLPGIRTG